MQLAPPLRSISPYGLKARSLCISFAAALALAGCGDDQIGSASDSDGATSSTSDAGSSESAGTTEGESEGDTDTDTDTDTGGPLNSFPVGGCGLPEYPLVDAALMGEIIDWALDLEFSASDIDGLLALNGFEALAPVASGARLYRIRYVTQDRGEKVEATGYIATPTDLDGPIPAGVWLHGTTGFTDICGPTADPQGGFVPLLMAALGYVTVAPDYIGLNGWGAPAGQLHPYVIGEPTAFASLDSIRALRRFIKEEGDPDADVELSAQTILWGASEGGFAALWSDRYAPHYAPELTITAVVASVPPTDALALTQYATGGLNPATGALAAALVSNHDWYRSDASLSEVLSAPLDVDLPAAMATTCNPDFAGITEVSQVYTPEMIKNLADADLDALGVWGCMLQRASLAEAAISLESKTPILFTMGELDDLVYTPTIRDSIPKLCGQGYTIEMIECAGAGHAAGAIEALPFARDWLAARLKGQALAEPCVLKAPVDCAALP